MSISIPLKGGFSAVIDDEMHHLASMPWRLMTVKNSTLRYAIRGNGTLLHRSVLGLQKGDGLVVDHIDGDGLNCLKNNLRIVSRQQNSRNVSGACRNNQSSGLLGVSWHKNRNCWVAHIRIGGKQQYLGRFDNKEDAEIARLKAEAAEFGVSPRRESRHRQVFG